MTLIQAIQMAIALKPINWGQRIGGSLWNIEQNDALLRLGKATKERFS